MSPLANTDKVTGTVVDVRATGAGLVIVGASHAGVTLAAAAREAGYAGPVTLLSAEETLPYHRPPLSKAYLGGNVAPAELMLRAPTFYDEAGIDLRLGARVEALDIDAREVRLADGRVQSYDALALATGTRPRTLACLEGLDGVATLRTLTDADRFRHLLADAHDVAVVGGGYVGLEVAATLEKGGSHRVTIVEAASRLAPRTMSAWSGRYLGERHAAAGARVLLGHHVAGADAAGGRVIALRLSDGERVTTDLVLLGIGVHPETALAEQGGLRCDNGILVDANLQTSAPHVYALGDCAAFQGEDGEQPARFECIQNATDAARRLAAHLVGRAGATVQPVPWFWTEQFGLRIQTAGLVAAASHPVLRGDPGTGRFSVWCFDGTGTLGGVETFNMPGEHMLARKLLAAGRGPTPSQAGDPGFDIRGLLA